MNKKEVEVENIKTDAYMQGITDAKKQVAEIIKKEMENTKKCLNSQHFGTTIEFIKCRYESLLESLTEWLNE